MMEETRPCSRRVPWGPCTAWCPGAGFRGMSRSLLSGEAPQATGNDSARERHCARACHARGAGAREPTLPAPTHRRADVSGRPDHPAASPLTVSFQSTCCLKFTLLSSEMIISINLQA